jgi:hypothetical protein
MPTYVYHILLGRSWKYDRKFIHDGIRHTYTLEKNGHQNVLFPLKYEGTKDEVGPSLLLMSGFSREIKKGRRHNLL